MTMTSAPTEKAAASSPASSSGPPQSGGRTGWKLPRIGFNLRGFVFAIGLIAALEFLTATMVTSANVPRPSEVGGALVAEIERGDILTGIGLTMNAYGQGLGLAIVLGVVLGAALGASTIAYNVFRVVIEFLRPLPSVALIPFSILLLGVGTTTTVAMITYASFWPILFNTYYGVRAVNEVAVDSARVFGLSRLAIFFRVQIPSAAASIATGVRVSASLALILVITVEILTRSGGLGYYIVRMQVAIRTEDMFAGIFLVGIIGYVIALLMSWMESRVIFWNSDIREEGGR